MQELSLKQDRWAIEAVKNISKNNQYSGKKFEPRLSKYERAVQNTFKYYSTFIDTNVINCSFTSSTMNRKFTNLILFV
jgi:hypothetical protein